MADRMEVDPRATADDSFMDRRGHRMKRARSADAILQEEHLIDLQDSNQEDFSPVMAEAESDQPSKESPVSMQKKSIIQRVGGLLTAPFIQQGPQDMSIQELRASLDEQQQTNSGLSRAVRNAGRKIERLESTIESALREKEELRRKRKIYKEANQSLADCLEAVEKELRAEKQDHREDISRLEGQIKALTHTSDQLRQMIVPVSEKQTHDMDVVSKFDSLNKSIHSLARQTWTTEFKLGVDLRHLHEHQQECLGAFLPLSYDRLRSVIFFGVHHIIFEPQAYFLGHGHRQFEECIQNVERTLNRNWAGDDRQRIMEWRDATFKATENLRDNGIQLSSEARNDIWNFLGPLQTKDAEAEQDGKKKLKAICDNATELNLMIRQLKDNFWVDSLASAVGKPLSQWDEWAEEEDSIPAPTNLQSGTIAYVIHGALIKSPKEDLGRVLVLRKAEVVVFQ